MSHAIMADKLREEVVQRYGAQTSSVRVILAPYRICPLGAHIDHQMGCVTAMAIDRGVMVAYAPNDLGRVRLSSFDFPGQVDFALQEVPDRREGDWGNYARGAVRALQKHYSLDRGISGVTSGSLSGGGLSSSAAIGVALLMALEEANSLNVSKQENIALDLAIENEYLGLRIGILDQSAILFSRSGHLAYIDCKTCEHRLIAYPDAAPPFSILIAFSGLQRALVGTDYNRRVEQCATAARHLLQAVGKFDGSYVLGRLTAEEYEENKECLDGAPSRRARHFFSEMQRVHAGVEAWRRGDLRTFGGLISASGESSIVNYECGCPPLVDLHKILIETEGVLGARFSGAGFRGCCLALVRPEAAKEAARSVRQAFARAHPDLAERADVMLCQSDDGARFL